MSNLVNRHWINFDGEPVTGRTPPSVLVYGPPMTPQQFGEVVHTYKLFTDANLVAVGDYQLRNRVLRDGTRVCCLSINGVDTVYVRTSGGGEMLYYFFYPHPIQPLYAIKGTAFTPANRRYPLAKRADGEDIIQTAYAGQQCKPLRKSDGVIQLMVGDTKGSKVVPSRFGFVAPDDREGISSLGTEVLLAGEPDGGNKCTLLPAIKDTETGLYYVGTYFHGKVKKTGESVTIESPDGSVSFPSIADVDIPNTHLVALDWLPEPGGIATSVSGPVEVRNKAILYGVDRNYDALTGIKFGRREFPYVPEPENLKVEDDRAVPRKKDLYFTVTLEHTQKTDPILRDASFEIYISVVVERGLAGEEQQKQTILPDEPFVFTAPLFGKYAVTSFFSPNCKKVCFLVHHQGDLSNEDFDAAVDNMDTRLFTQPMFAIEGVLSGGSEDEFPTCAFSLVDELPEYRRRDVSEDGKVVYDGYFYRNGQGSSFVTGWGYQESSGSSSSYVDEDGNGYYSRQTTDFDLQPISNEAGSIVERTEGPILICYDNDSNLQVFTYLVESHQTASPGSIYKPPETTSVDFDLFRLYKSSTIEISGITPAPFSWESTYSAGKSASFSIMRNGSQIAGGTLFNDSRSFLQESSGYWEAVPFGDSLILERTVLTSNYTSQAYGNYSAVAPRESAGVVQYSNNVSVLGVGSSVNDPEYYVITPSGIKEVLSEPPSTDPQPWGAWNPVTDEITFEENTSWC